MDKLSLNQAFFIRLMKISLAQVFIAVMFSGISLAHELGAQGILSRPVNLRIVNQPLDQALNTIQKAADVKFAYRSVLLPPGRTVTLEISGEPLGEVLNRLLRPLDIGYEVTGARHIVLRKKEAFGSAVPIIERIKQHNANFIGRVLKGRVTDEKGEGLPGVSVVVKGTQQGTITDAEGVFSFDVPDENTVLVFSFVGYVSQELAVGNRTSLEVTLKVDEKALEEVVVIGYGAVKKKDLTGAVMQVRSEEILKTNSTTLAGALQGQVPADIGSAWKPGSNPVIEIRGISSITGSNAPLWVVDGIPLQSSSVNLNPVDIESIDILKDASASAIYGARGSNGVIIVTTKRASVGDAQIKISYNGWVGMEKLSNRPDLMSPDEFLDYKRTALKNAGRNYSDEVILDAVERATLQNRNFTDWYDLVWGGRALATNHNFSIRAAGKKTASMLSLSYLDQGSLIETAGFKRYNLNFNNTYEFSERLKFSSAILASYSKNDNFHPFIRHAYYLSPFGTPYEEDGSLKLYTNPNETLITSPLAEIHNNENTTKQYGLIGSASMDWRIWDELRFKFSAGMDLTYRDNGIYEGSQTRNRNGGAHAASYESNKRLSTVFGNVLSYNKQINDIHRLDFMGGFNMETYRSESVYLKATDMFFDGLYYNLESASTVLDKNSRLSEWGIMSFMGRLNYSLLERYLFTFTYRYDGSSRLSEKNKWSGFPSVSGAWRLSEEPFMLPLKEKFLDNLKFRLSWGNTGNTNVDPYGTLGRLSTTYYSWNETPALGTIPTGIPNPDLKWEKTEEYNWGLDVSLFKSRLNGTVDLYNRTTKDLILARNLPATSGYTTITQNIGSTRNKGIEVILNGDILRKKDFRWNMGISFFRNKNEILDLFGDNKDDLGSLRFIGHPVRVNYLLDFVGVWQENEAEQAALYKAKPGYPKYRDIYNREGVSPGINIGDDRYIISREPSWLGGLITTIEYKGVDLYMNFNTRQGEREWSDVHRISFDDPVRFKSFAGNYWTAENRSQTDPAPAVVGTYPDLPNSDYFVKSVSFVRLSNVSLGYTFPLRLAQKMGMENAKVYVNISNPLVWTSYTGQDPQVIHREAYPATTSYQLGINLNF